MAELRHFEVQMGVPGSAPSWMMSIDESSQSTCVCKATGSVAAVPRPFPPQGAGFMEDSFSRDWGP